MRLTYVIDNLRVGGAQVHLSRLAAGLARSGRHDVEIVALGPASPVVAAALPPEVALRSLPMESIRRPSFWAGFVRLVRHLRERRPAIVHTYLNTAGVFGIAAARLAGTGRVVASRRDMGAFRSRRVRALEAFLSRRWAARVVCVCEAVASETVERERLPRERVRVIYNGVDTRGIAPRSQYRAAPPLVLGMVASMDRVEKGHRELLAAVGLAARKRGHPVPLHLVGDGPLRGALEAAARAEGVADATRFLGTRADVTAVLAEVDVAVVPSHTEGISNATLEAMACGLPVVATAVDGNLETVVAGETGQLVPPHDSDALAAALLTYWDDPGIAERHGRAGRRRAEKSFDLATMIRRYEAEYDDLVGRAGSGLPSR